MSVAQLSVNDFGLFAAVAVELKLLPFADAVSTAEFLSRSNCAALRAQYGLSLDSSEGIPVTFDDIEANALHRLAKRDFSGHCGPLLYNCVTNNGTTYFGELPATPSEEITSAISMLESLEKSVQNWLSAESRRIERQRENDAAFVDVGPLPKLTVEECQAMMDKLGMNRVIYADFRVNESDSYTDYYGGRTARTVIIGFASGKRESFKQLRTAAGEFPPTSDYALGCDQWRVTAFRGEKDEYGRADREQLRDDHYNVMEFPTKSDAETYVANLIATSAECQPGYTGCVGFPRFAQAYGVEYHHESFENRENYSMGGGNYLGRHRYSGWIVRSTTYPMAGEYFEAPKKVAPVARKSPKAERTVAEESPAVEITPTISDLYCANV